MLRRALDQRRIVIRPMSQNRLIGKRMTCLFGLLGDAYNEVQVTILEFLPRLASCIGRINSKLLFKDLEGDQGDFTSGFGTGAKVSKRFDPRSRNRYSAKMLLAAFQVQRNRILNRSVGVSMEKAVIC